MDILTDVAAGIEIGGKDHTTAKFKQKEKKKRKEENN